MRSDRPQLRLVTTDDTTTPDARALNRLDWIAAGLLALVLAFAPLLAPTFPTPPQTVFAWDTKEALGVPALIAMTALAFLILLYREIKRPVAIGGIPGLTGAVALLAIWAALSLIRTPAFGQSLNALAVLLAALLLGGMLSRLARDPNGFAVLLFAVALGGSIIAGIGVNEFLAKWKAHDPQLRSFATFFNPNFLAGYLLLTLPLTLGAFVAARDRLASLALGIGLALQSACLLLTASRAGAGMGVAAIIVWLALAAYSGAIRGKAKQVGLGLLIFLVSAGLASAPTLSRVTGVTPAPSTAKAPAAVSNVEAQSHSGAYRRLTWTGTVKMLTANPALGAGLGSYDVTYPRYTLAAPTAHAHNSFLQWGAETGILGLLGLLAALAAATAFAANVLRLQRQQAQEDSGADEFAATKAQSPPARTPGDLFDSPALILAGLLASVFASMLHSLFDSDWYIVCSAVTLSGILGLLLAQSRDLAPLATHRPAPLTKPLLGIGVVIALFLLWRAGATGTARMALRDAGAQMVEAAERSSGSATLGNDLLTLYQSAATADPFDPEPSLGQAQVYLSLRERDRAKAALETAVRIAPTGKTFYRLARFLAQEGDLNAAVTAFQKAREAEPKNVQNLRQLAETLQKANRTEEAVAVYQTMTDLENATYGQVRAMPDMVETEFAYAHLRLADIAATKSNWQEAVTEYARAAAVFREYWQKRNLHENLLRGEAKRREIADDYAKTLTGWQDALRKAGKTSEISAIEEEQKRFKKERAEDEAQLQEQSQ